MVVNCIEDERVIAFYDHTLKIFAETEARRY